MKSISIKTKLAILVIIPLIAALIVTVLGLFYVNKISSNLTQSLYNEGFQSISLVLNADRDLYQALDSVNGLLMENSKGVLDPASKEEFIAGYEENAVQTSDRVKEAVDLLSENKEFWSEIKDDSGANVFDHYASFEENFAKWEEMSAGITTTYVSTEEWTAQFDSSREDMNVIGELVEVGIQKSITDNEASKTDMVTMMILIDVVVLALVLFLSIFIIRAITIPLKKSVTMLQEMVRGRLSHRLNLNQKDEIGIMADTLDQYAENLQLNVIGTMKKISEGDLNMDIQITDSEDEISPVMKLTVDNLKALVSEAEMLTAAAMEGNLSARGNADAFQGGYYHILAGVNSTLDSVIGPLNVAADYMDRISKGDIPPVITDEYHGDFDQIKNNINTCINAIDSLVEDMDILSVATVKGDLLVRSDAGKHSGDFAKIVEGVNLTLDTLVGFIDEMPAPVMIINNDYDIQYMNKIGSSILGKTQNELTGQKCYDNFKTSHCRTENCSCTRAMKLDDKVTAETDAHPNGMDLEISYTGRPIKDRNNNIIGAVELIVDQTDIKRAAKLAEKQAEYQLVEVERLIYNLEKISVGDLDLSLTIGAVDEDTAIVGQNFEKINSSLSQSVDALKAMMDDVNRLAQAAVEGRLDTRADAAHHQGDYRKIVEGVNGTLNAVIEPIKEASEVLQEMAKGNLKVGMFGNYQGDLDDLKTALNQTISSMVTYMTEIATVLTKMGQGNLNQAITADYRGDFVVMKESLNGILESLNDVLGDINEAAEQVASGSRQVSDGSQALSQGSTEQASSIQELTASIIELADQTKQNAVNANQASTLAETAKSNAERGNDQMKEMLTSMSDINDSSANISKIIKVIDDIAFQTNILALNAAVEAARAGQHGKGFAVVAEEVRNLAARSADAAKETTALIEGSINKVQTGTKIANETAAALIEIVDGIEKSASLISNIAESSNNQASGISQINRGIEQVSQVVQNNAATAEESAASSEELSSQAELLKQMVGRFELNGAKALKNAGTKLLGGSTPRAAAVSDYQILLSDDEYDKY